MRHVLLVICLLALSSATVDADLRYRMRLEVRTPFTELKAAMPSADTVMLIKGNAIRIEHTQGAVRSVLLIRPDGQFVLDLDARTYWRTPDIQAVLTSRGAAASPIFRRTGEFTSILGLRAERVEMTISVPLPITPPPGLPTVLPVTGELWVADAHRPYAKSISRAIELAGGPASGLDGIVLRQVVRDAQFGIEIEHVVTELIETPLGDEMFELPEGFRVIGPAGRQQEPLRQWRRR